MFGGGAGRCDEIEDRRQGASVQAETVFLFATAAMSVNSVVMCIVSLDFVHTLLQLLSLGVM